MDVFSYFVGDFYNSPELVLQWYRNLKERYCYDMERRFVVYTDNPHIKNFEYFIDDITVVVVRPEPDINVRKRQKFYLILDYIKNYSCGRIFSFIQSNCICNRKIHSSELYRQGKITINESCWYEKNHTPFMVLYSNTPNSITFLDKPIEKSYFQAGHFVGDRDIILTMSKWIVMAMDNDLSKNVCTKWHDETYFNFYFAKVRPADEIAFIVRGDKYLSGIQGTGDIVALDKKQLFRNYIPIEKTLSSLCEQMKKFIGENCRNACVLIGANPSIQSKKLGKTIDSSSDFIVRLNRVPDPKYKDNCGMRTSFFIGCQGTLKNIPNKLIITDDQLKLISRNFIPFDNKWLHTGFIAILLLIRIFKVVKIFGFGFDNEKEDDDDVKFTHEYSMVGRENHHFINFEHNLIDNLVKESKIFRMENLYNV